MTTFSDLVSSEIIRNELTPLYEASGMVGSLQIRNVATIGGNIVNRASAADGVNALLVLGADLSILGSDGEERLVSMEEFLKSGIDSKDVLKEIIIKPLNDGYKGAFTKVGNRSRVTVSQVILSGVCKVEGDVVIDLKLALGAVGSYSFIPLEVCNWSKGQVVDGEFKRLLEDKLSAAIEGSIPDRSSMPYKRVAVKGLLDNIYSKLFE